MYDSVQQSEDVYVCVKETERQSTSKDRKQGKLYTQENNNQLLQRGREGTYVVINHHHSMFSYYNYLLGKRGELIHLLTMCHRS